MWVILLWWWLGGGEGEGSACPGEGVVKGPQLNLSGGIILQSGVQLGEGGYRPGGSWTTPPPVNRTDTSANITFPRIVYVVRENEVYYPVNKCVVVSGFYVPEYDVSSFRPNGEFVGVG